MTKPKPKVAPKQKVRPKIKVKKLPHGFTSVDGMMFVKGNILVDRDVMEIWMRRDIDKNVDLKIVNLKDGFFSVIRDSSDIIPLETLKNTGYTVISESEFNDAFIEVTQWIIGNLPTRSKTRSRKLINS